MSPKLIALKLIRFTSGFSVVISVFRAVLAAAIRVPPPLMLLVMLWVMSITTMTLAPILVVE